MNLDEQTRINQKADSLLSQIAESVMSQQEAAGPLLGLMWESTVPSAVAHSLQAKGTPCGEDVLSAGSEILFRKLMDPEFFKPELVPGGGFLAWAFKTLKSICGRIGLTPAREIPMDDAALELKHVEEPLSSRYDRLQGATDTYLKMIRSIAPDQKVFTSAGAMITGYNLKKPHRPGREIRNRLKELVATNPGIIRSSLKVTTGPIGEMTIDNQIRKVWSPYSEEELDFMRTRPMVADTLFDSAVNDFPRPSEKVITNFCVKVGKKSRESGLGYSESRRAAQGYIESEYSPVAFKNTKTKSPPDTSQARARYQQYLEEHPKFGRLCRSIAARELPDPYQLKQYAKEIA